MADISDSRIPFSSWKWEDLVAFMQEHQLPGASEFWSSSRSQKFNDRQFVSTVDVDPGTMRRVKDIFEGNLAASSWMDLGATSGGDATERDCEQFIVTVIEATCDIAGRQVSSSLLSRM